MKKILILLSVIVLSGCNCFQPRFMVWDSEKEAYVESEWSAKQTKVFDENVQLGEDGHLHLAISEEEARKLGVTRRMYKTFLYNINQANQNIDSFGDSIQVSCPVGSKPFANKQ